MYTMPNDQIIQPGDLIFFTIKGLDQIISLEPVEHQIEQPGLPVVQPIYGDHEGRMVQYTMVDNPKIVFGKFPTPNDGMLVLKNFFWTSMETSQKTWRPFTTAPPPQYVAAAVINVLFGKRPVMFALWLDKGQILEDLIWGPRIVPERYGRR
jgi:hypothetical protein